MARRVSSPEFIGREPERAALVEALDRASVGEFAAIFVAGDAGVGKSRLLAELKREVAERGARVLAGDCVTLSEGELPYAPLRSALRGLDPDELLRPRRGGEPVAQDRLFELLLALLARLAEDAPIVLIIEDIHWADRSTLDFLAFLAGAARRERILLICTYRTDTLHRGHALRPFLAEQERRPAAERVELDAFTPEETGAQVQGILGTTPDPALVQRVHQRTEGNAFFAEELLAASVGADALPASLRDALLLRIEVLSPEAQQVLRVASAHGRAVTHRLLASVSDLPDAGLDAALREAVSHHVLVQRDAETYAFRHALLQETLAADLLPGELAALHLALAVALEGDPALASRAALYTHWLGAGRVPEALAAAVRAGTEAEEVYAFAEAIQHFERALELWGRVEDPAERTSMDQAEIYARAAQAAHLSGGGERSVKLVRAAIDRADARADPYRAALLRERLGRYLLFSVGDLEAVQDAYQEAVDLLPADQPRPELARVLAALGQVLMMRGRNAESAERCEQALAVARQVGARAEEAHALGTHAANVGFRDDRTKGIEYLREAVRIDEEIGEVDGLPRLYGNLSEILDQDGQTEEAAEVALAGARRSAELGLRFWRDMLHGEAATRLVKLGRLNEADRLTEAALELTPSLAKWDQCAARARLEVYRGRVEDAERLLEAVVDTTAESPGPTWTEPLASTRVEFELLRGRPEAARAAGARMLGEAAAGEMVAFTARLHAATARADAELAEAARAGGDDAAAARCAGHAAQLVERISGLLAPEAWTGPPSPDALACAGACEAEAARAAGTATGANWAAVANRWAALGMPVDECYARLREAEAHVRLGEWGPAAEAARAGLRLAEETGATVLGDQLASLARRARLPVDVEAEAEALAAAADFGLTERERAVLELVAEGMTNRQIGEALFMSQKTASVHVSRILTKLDVSSRVEAATAAQRLGLVR